jgi:hypothetical protein
MQRQDTRPRLGSGIESIYRVTFPRVLKDGSPLITGLSDTMQLQMRLGFKTFVLEYKLKEMVKEPSSL